jgi:hypothetical protein
MQRIAGTRHRQWRTRAFEIPRPLSRSCPAVRANGLGDDGPGSAVIDFWVPQRNVPSGEFWFIEGRGPLHAEADALVHDPSEPAVLRDQTVRVVRHEDLQAWSVPIANRSLIVAYLVSHRRYRDPLLELLKTSRRRGSRCPEGTWQS